MFKHTRSIVFGTKGEVSKIEEEVAELKDATSLLHKIFELSDIVESVGQYSRKQCWCPLFIVLIFCYARSVYKPIRNWFLNRFGHRKDYYFPND